MNTIDYAIPETATDQEVFDIVARHLLTQGRRALWGEACAYRTPEGDRCAIGALIPDEVYKLEWEGCAGAKLYEYPELHQYLPRTRALATALQSIHDISFPDRWRIDLRAAAAVFGLNTRALDE